MRRPHITITPQFRDGYKPFPAARTNEAIKKPVLKQRKLVKQIVNQYEDLILPPPPQFRDGYQPVPAPRTDRPLQIRENQNARRPPKPQRSPPQPPKKEHEDPIIPPLQFRDDKPLQESVPAPTIKNRAPKIEKLDQALKGHTASYMIEIQDNLDPMNHFFENKRSG